MSKKLVAAIAAAVLAVLGVVALLVYASTANQRAHDGAELVEVLRVTETIPAGTSAKDAAHSLETAEVPRAAVPENALRSLDSVAGQDTNTELQAGEVLLATRFGAAQTQGKADTTVPKGYQEVSISLAPPQVTGGSLSSGDRVGLMASYDGETRFVMQNLQVTRIAGTVVNEATDGAAGTPLLITFAVKTRDAEKIVNAAQFGTIWLTLENDDTDRSGSKLVAKKDVIG